MPRDTFHIADAVPEAPPEAPQQTRPPLPRIFFRLRETGIGGVTLYAVTERGERMPGGNILTINSRGYLNLHCAIHPAIGVRKTEDGKIQLGG